MYEKCLETFSFHQNIFKSNLFSDEEIVYWNERKMWSKIPQNHIASWTWIADSVRNWTNMSEYQFGFKME